MALARVEGKEETGNVAELLAVLVLAVLRWPDTGARDMGKNMGRKAKAARKPHECYVSGGSGEIRTHGRLPVAGFQDRCNRPLCHASKMDEAFDSIGWQHRRVQRVDFSTKTHIGVDNAPRCGFAAARCARGRSCPQRAARRLHDGGGSPVGGAPCTSAVVTAAADRMGAAHRSGLLLLYRINHHAELHHRHLMPDQVHMMLSKYAVSQVVGFIKSKSAIHLARVCVGSAGATSPGRGATSYRRQGETTRPYGSTSVTRKKKGRRSPGSVRPVEMNGRQ